MTNSYKDENGVSEIIGVSSADGVTPTLPWANVSTHNLLVADNTTGSDNGNHGGIAMRDENNVAVLIAVSSVDGRTPIELYVDPITHMLLVNSN